MFINIIFYSNYHDIKFYAILFKNPRSRFQKLWKKWNTSTIGAAVTKFVSHIDGHISEAIKSCSEHPKICQNIKNQKSITFEIPKLSFNECRRKSMQEIKKKYFTLT